MLLTAIGVPFRQNIPCLREARSDPKSTHPFFRREIWMSKHLKFEPTDRAQMQSALVPKAGEKGQVSYLCLTLLGR
jgi:hypothetical protein